jgi:O-antigen/teichoic acid export membrane protein
VSSGIHVEDRVLEVRFVQASLVTYASTIGTAGLSALTNIIIARTLGPGGRGDVAILLLTPMLLTRLGGFSLGKASIYLVGRKKVPFSSAFWASLLGSLALGGMLTLLGFILYESPAGERLFQGISSSEVGLAICLAPPLLYWGYLQDLQRASNHMGMYNWMHIQHFGLDLLLIVALIVFFELSTVAAVVAWAVALSLSVIVGFTFLLLAERPFLHFEVGSIASSLKAMVTYGSQVHLMNVVGFLGYRFDAFLIMGFLDSTALGYYTVATNISRMLWFLPDSVGAVLLPKVARMRSEDAAQFTPLVARTVLLATLALGLIVFVFASPIVTLLYSVEFLPAVAPLRILLIGAVVFCLYKVFGRDLIARGKALLATIAMGTSVAVAIGLNLVLIPRLGIEGAAWTSTVSYLMATLIIAVTYLRTSGISISRLLTWNAHDLKVYRRLLGGLSRYLPMRH